MAAKVGLDGKLYRNTGTFATPTWVEVKNVSNLTAPGDIEMAEAIGRGYGKFKTHVPTLANLDIEFDMVWDRSDTQLVALETAYNARAVVELNCMDGDRTVTGNAGWRGEYYVSEFKRSEQNTDAMTAHVVLKLAFTTNAGSPSYFVAP